MDKFDIAVSISRSRYEEGDFFGGSGAEIDRAHLLEDARHGDVCQRAADIFSTRDMRFLSVVGERDIQNALRAFEVLVRGPLDAFVELISIARHVRDRHRSLALPNRLLNGD
jgi:hypothetical protein